MERARPGFAAVGVLAAAALAGAASAPPAPTERPPMSNNRRTALLREPAHKGSRPGRGRIDEHDPKRVEKANAKRDRKAKRRLQEALARERSR